MMHLNAHISVSLACLAVFFYIWSLSKRLFWFHIVNCINPYAVLIDTYQCLLHFPLIIFFLFNLRKKLPIIQLAVNPIRDLKNRFYVFCHAKEYLSLTHNNILCKSETDSLSNLEYLLELYFQVASGTITNILQSIRK